jgi:hypothetical protein
MKLKKEDKV